MLQNTLIEHVLSLPHPYTTPTLPTHPYATDVHVINKGLQYLVTLYSTVIYSEWLFDFTVQFMTL